MALQGLQSEEEILPRLQAAKAEGYREAESRSMAQVRAALENIEKVVDEISKFRRELFKECDRDVFELVGVIAKKVVLKELSLNPDLLKDIVQKSLSLLEKEKQVVLQLNPQDLEFFKKAKPDFLETYKGIEELGFEVDSRIPSGGLIAKSKKIELDINAASMVDHILSQVKNVRSEISASNNEGDV
jgi:flagellar assembly protein FliH